MQNVLKCTNATGVVVSTTPPEWEHCQVWDKTMKRWISRISLHVELLNLMIKCTESEYPFSHYILFYK